MCTSSWTPIQTNILGLNWYILISDTSLFQFVPRVGMDPTVQSRVQTDTEMDNRLAITLMGNVKQVVRLDGKMLTVEVPVEGTTSWVLTILKCVCFHPVISK